MGKILIDDVIKVIEREIPPCYAADFDNVGLLVGDKTREITGITVALDCKDDVIDFAKENGCNLIVTHHPLVFNPIKNVTNETAVGRLICKLIENGIALYSVHTNYDRTDGGTDDILAEKIGMIDAKRIENNYIDGKNIGFGRIGKSVCETAGELKKRIEAEIGGKVISTADDDKKINIIASCAGAGGDFFEDAIANGADIFVTGEAKYHNVLDAKTLGLDVILCSHETSEQISINHLNISLQKRLNGVQYNIQVVEAPFYPLWK